MSDLSSALAGISFAGMIAVIVGYIRLKRTLKEEIVDPDISRLEGLINSLKEEFARKLAKVEEENYRMSDKLDKKFEELNRKMDKNSQAVSNMQGMLTAIFNGMKYGQQ